MAKRIVTVAFSIGLIAVSEIAGAQAGRTIWDGIYTEAQAARGREAYVKACQECHGDNLISGQRPLKGPQFVDNWREDALESLFSKIVRTMPRNSVGFASDAEKLDTLAFLLQQNDAPPGKEELRVDELLGIRFVAKAGPAPLPAFALVETVGCLTAGDGDAWMLTASTPLVRRRDASPVPDGVLKEAGVKPAGTYTVRLRSVYADGAARKGQKVLVKGPLLRNDQEEAIDVSTLQATGVPCGP